MKSTFFSALTALVGPALVAAHGFVDTASIGGETYTFYQPYQDPYTSPTPERVSREIQGNGPVEDVTSADIQCGGYSAGGITGSKPAALHAKATAGETVTLNWTLWPDSHVGPVLTYMAKCPDTGCADYMPGTDAVWFKVQEGGREGTSNNWAATPLMKAGGAATYTIPECLASGFYLVRHEIIALHAAYAYPGAQFYPGCHQLEVSGSGSTTPSTGLVAFPGAYKPEDAGITYDPYKATEYTLPGPALFSCSGNGGGSSPAPAPSASAPAASSSAAATSAPATTLSTSRAPGAVATTTTSSSAAVTSAPSATTPAPSTPTDDAECPADDDEEDDEEDDACDATELPTSTKAPTAVATPTPSPTSAAPPAATPTDDAECPADDEEDDEDDDADCPAESPTPTAVARRHARALF